MHALGQHARRRVGRALVAGVVTAGIAPADAAVMRLDRAARQTGAAIDRSARADAQDRGATPQALRGGRVVDALAHLQVAAGVQIVFSSSLVPPSLVVQAEPRAATPRQRAIEILAPHGLTLKDGPRGVWLVVRLPRKSPPRTMPAPRSSSAAAPASAPAPSSAAAPRETDPQAPAPQAPRVEEHVEVTQRLGEFAGQPAVKRLDPVAVRDTAGGLENVLQVLPLLPGIVATDDEQGKLAVRGAGPQHNVLIFDGVQIHSPQRYGDFTSSFINPATAANVSLDASGLDARHGGRLSSVLVLETRDGRTDRRFALSGSLGLTSGDLLAEGRLPGTRSGSWWATVRGTYYRFVGDRLRDEEAPHFTDAQFKVTLHPSRRTRLSIVGLLGAEGLEKPLPVAQDPEIIEGMIQQASRADTRLGAANLWWTPGRRVTMITTLSGYANGSRYQDHWKSSGFTNGHELPQGPFDRRVRVQDIAARQRLAVAWAPDRALDAGVEVRRLRTTWQMSGGTHAPWWTRVGPNTWGELMEHEGPIDARMARTQASGWLQQRLPVGAGIEIEPGLRLDWNSFTRERAVQPRLRIMRRFGETAVWGGVAWQAQTPGYETMQQGVQFYDLATTEATLRNERARQVVLGVERPLTAGSVVRVELYHRALDRLLVQRLETDDERARRWAGYLLPPDMPADDVVMQYRPTIHPRSSGTGRATGLELQVRRDRGRLAGWLSYSWSRAERELYGRTVPFDFDRRHGLAAVMQWQVSSGVRLGVTTQLASGTPTTPLHDEVVFLRAGLLPDGTPDRRLRTARRTDGSLLTQPIGYPNRLSLYNTERTRMYARTDVRVTYALRRHWSFYGEVLNVFNRHNHTQPLYLDSPSSSSSPPPTQWRGVFQAHPFLVSYGLRATF